jgi:tagatose-6-phosphate ketose/aldose isomerase
LHTKVTEPDYTNWFGELAADPELADLFALPVQEQQRAGYYHTLREICQQPLTWQETAGGVVERQAELREILKGAEGQPIIVTGSGSSLYAGECLALLLEESLGVPVLPIGGGELLLRSIAALRALRPRLLISLARSGDSPESLAAVDLVRSALPDCRQLIITCNQKGRLANGGPGFAIVLADRTCDRSLAMTSSFTNMVLAGMFLSATDRPDAYLDTAATLSRAGRHLLLRYPQALARIARGGFHSAVYLGSNCRYGAARESALKILEMTAGETPSFAETYMGLRHGPMCVIHDDTLAVLFLASDSLARAYEVDLIRELNRKRLGCQRVIVGENIPKDLLAASDLAVECPGAAELGDHAVAVLDVMVGQLLAFFRCLHLGHKPDSPSEEGVINRVVASFAIHSRARE